MTALEIVLSAAGAVIAVLLFILEVHGGPSLGQRSRQERLAIGAVAVALTVLAAGIILRLHHKRPPVRSENGLRRGVDVAVLRQIDVGLTREFISNLLGTARVRKILQRADLGVDVKLLYERYEKGDYQVQTIADADDEIVAFVIRGTLKAPYIYRSDPINWTLGQTTFATIGEFNERLLGGDAKFPAYVERHYFGRWGHYNNFWFADRAYSGDLEDYLRAANVPDSVAVATSPSNTMSNDDIMAWNAFMTRVVSLHAERFEGL